MTILLFVVVLILAGWGLKSVLGAINATTKTLNKAADRMDASRPADYHSIDRLEERVGTGLTIMMWIFGLLGLLGACAVTNAVMTAPH